jgi:hypothetical protein
VKEFTVKVLQNELPFDEAYRQLWEDSSPFIANAITTEALEPRLGCQCWREFNPQNSVSASSQTPRSPPSPLVLLSWRGCGRQETPVVLAKTHGRGTLQRSGVNRQDFRFQEVG